MKKTLLGALTLTIVAMLSSNISIAQDNLYYQSRATNNWGTNGAWMSSSTPTGYSNTSIAPNASSKSIRIRSGHTITINIALTIDEIIIESGGTLEIAAGSNSVAVSLITVQNGGTIRWTSGNLNVSNAAGDDLVIEGTYTDNRDADALPSLSTGASILVKSSGSIRNTVTRSIKAGYAANSTGNIAQSIIWESGAIFDWAANTTFPTDGVTYFPKNEPTIPVFKYSNGTDRTLGGNNATIINGVFEVSQTNADITWQNAGTKTFRNGITGVGRVIQNNNCGKFSFTGSTALFSIESLILNSSNGLVIETGCSTDLQVSTNTNDVNYNASNGAEITVANGGRLNIINNWPNMNGPVEILNGGTIDCRNRVILSDDNDDLIVRSGGTFISAHADGVDGNVPDGNDRNLYPGSNYIFNGNVNQTTGYGMPTSIGNLTIDNSGATNNNDVYISFLFAQTVTGNILINKGRLSLNNDWVLGYWGDLVLHGDFTRVFTTGAFRDNGRTVFLRGTGITNISTPLFPGATGAPSSQQQFGRLVIEKSGIGKVKLLTNTGINNKLTLSSGIIDANSYGLFIHNQAPDDAYNGIVGGSATAYIAGVLYREMQTSSTLSGFYSFPIGKAEAGGYRPLMFNSAVSTGSAAATYKAEYFGGNGTITVAPADAENDFFGSNVTGILKNEFWQFDRISGTVSGKLAILYTVPTGNGWRNMNNMDISPSDANNVAVVKGQSTVNSNGGTNWDFTKPEYNFAVTGAQLEARNAKEAGWIWSGNLTSFSPFSIGFGNNTILGSFSTLPVKLLSFTGTAKGYQGLLNWTIDSDKDLSGFVVEQSINGQQFQPAKTIGPNGSSYSNQKVQLKPGTNYFRLKVQEKTGYSYYSQVLILNASESKTIITGLQQTVVQQKAVALVQSANNQSAEVMLIDLSGKQLLSKSVSLQTGGNQIQLPTGNLQKGLYFMLVRTQDAVQRSLRFVKE